MTKTQELLREKYDIVTNIEHGIINGDNGYIKIQITPPSGEPSPCRTNWRLRMHPSESFECWSKPVAICEEFDNEQLMAEYLTNVTNIYRILFHYLSHDHKKVKKERDRHRIPWL